MKSDLREVVDAAMNAFAVLTGVILVALLVVTFFWFTSPLAYAKLSMCQFFEDGYYEGWCATKDEIVCVGPPVTPLCFEGDHRSEMGAFQTGWSRGQRDALR